MLAFSLSCANAKRQNRRSVASHDSAREGASTWIIGGRDEVGSLSATPNADSYYSERRVVNVTMANRAKVQARRRNCAFA